MTASHSYTCHRNSSSDGKLIFATGKIVKKCYLPSSKWIRCALETVSTLSLCIYYHVELATAAVATGISSICVIVNYWCNAVPVTLAISQRPSGMMVETPHIKEEQEGNILDLDFLNNTRIYKGTTSKMWLTVWTDGWRQLSLFLKECQMSFSLSRTCLLPSSLIFSISCNAVAMKVDCWVKQSACGEQKHANVFVCGWKWDCGSPVRITSEPSSLGKILYGARRRR